MRNDVNGGSAPGSDRSAVHPRTSLITTDLRRDS
jgi:hypothetical protein